MPTPYASISRSLELYGRLTLLIGVVLLTVLYAGQSWTARGARLLEVQTETDNLASSLSQHVQDVFETTGALLKTLSDRVSLAGRDPAAILRLNRQLRVRVDAQKLLHGVAVFDEHGDWIATSLAAPDFTKVSALNFAERDFFHYHRDHAGDVALISPPIQSRLDGAWVVSMSQRLSHPDGSFAGVAQAAIDVELFQRFFETFAIGKEGAITLASGGGAIIARRPFDQNNVGRNFINQRPSEQISNWDEVGGFAATSSLIDAVTRLGSLHRVPGFDLMVIVALAKDEVLADWWHDTKVHSVWLALTVLFAVILGHRVSLQMRDRIAAEASAQKLRIEVARLDTKEAEHRVHDRALENANADLKQLSIDLAQARDKAEQANRAKSRFLAGVSHELRTPLNGILGYAQLLHIGGDLSDVQATRVAAMLGAGKHLLQMITCVLDLSEIEADRLDVQAVELDLWAVAEACMDLIRPAAEAKGLALSMNAAPGTPMTLIADATRLRQILLNLLGNAAKFTIRGTIALHIRHSTDAASMRIEVADTGPGITAEQRQCLFMDFERLDTEGTRAVEGAGLGLALSFRLAEVMGGRLGHDDNPDGGSLFWLELPLDTVATAIPGLTLAANSLNDASALMPLRPLHILVADDVLMNREIAAEFLRTASHTVVCVEGGAEAIAAVARSDFDLVLMDIRMPEMDGLEATRRIRALEGKRGKLPILALTAHAFPEQVADCRRAGMDGHLAKPFDLDTLLAAVARTFVAGHMNDQSSSADTNVAASKFAAPVIDPEQPVLDMGKFEQTAAFLTPDTITDYLRTIATLGQSLLYMLDAKDVHLHNGDALADAAHTLTGSAGMFGFGRLSVTARLFERAARAGSADFPVLSNFLRQAIVATDQAILALTRNAAQSETPSDPIHDTHESDRLAASPAG